MLRIQKSNIRTKESRQVNSTNLLHGAESSSRSHRLLIYSRISQHFMKPKVYYHVNSSPPMAPALSQMKPVHTTPSYFSKIHFLVTLPPTSRFSCGLLFEFPFETLYPFLYPPMHATCPTHLILLGFTLISFGEE
jgi:hypothetical protein